MRHHVPAMAARCVRLPCWQCADLEPIAQAAEHVLYALPAACASHAGGEAAGVLCVLSMLCALCQPSTLLLAYPRCRWLNEAAMWLATQNEMLEEAAKLKAAMEVCVAPPCMATRRPACLGDDQLGEQPTYGTIGLTLGMTRRHACLITLNLTLGALQNTQLSSAYAVLSLECIVPTLAARQCIAATGCPVPALIAPHPLNPPGVLYPWHAPLSRPPRTRCVKPSARARARRPCAACQRRRCCKSLGTACCCKR